ncbi:DNA binding protein-like protein SART-1 [Bimuria novae-zelandiae CBS 107.79]|uniref:DNA binding protein-like protein SART-1 n=1 Tax=Bimuria novae-zelandiae CBS 107.79 TaxID=1447943 RepID=A0A6A5VLJ8_9PLEO|nr:DNA binding protein-like protein SART-1 [Bimuria novae-zelandiae CBS 107.79]
MADLSIEEANKIRLSMGLAPLPVPGAAAPSGPTFKQAQAGDDPDEEPASTIESREAAGFDNWKKLQDEAAAKKKREDRLAAIKKEREKAARFAKLEGKGLADAAQDEDDMAWLKGSKKRQKKIAKAEQMQKELEERERQAREALEYTEADLAGVKVGHEVDQFEDGEDQVLVLKDTAVDAEDEDELEAVALKEKERLQEKLDSKKRKRTYDPNDDGQQSILAQYDETIEGKKRNAFTLDGQGRTVEQMQAEAAGAAKPKRVAISLDILQDDTPANDYMDISEVKMKKLKKKKSKSSKRKHVEDDEDMFAVPEEPADEMEVDGSETKVAPKKAKKNLFDESFVDDDDLQAQLAAQRRQALKKRKKMRPEDLARQLREEGTSAPGTPGEVMDSTEPNDEDAGALIIDETTEFVHNLGANAVDDAQEAPRRRSHTKSHISWEAGSPTVQVDDEGDVDMEQSYAEVAEREERSTSRAKSADITVTGLDDEKLVASGVGATLALLKQRGLVSSSEGGDKNMLFRERQKFLADKMHAEERAEQQRKLERERDRNSDRYRNMSARDKEEDARRKNDAAEKKVSRELADIFNKEYKPTFELTHTDEHGRVLNEKEAFKLLSHQFHGKGSGNTKTKKHLDKIEQEKRKIAEHSLDTRAGGLSNAQDQQAKKNKFAGVRLQ